LRIAADASTFRNLRRLENRTLRWPPDSPPLKLRLRPLGKRPLFLRPQASDVYVLQEILEPEPEHLPPPGGPDPPAVVWDLGANCGLTMADMACRFPSARVVGVELDPLNAELARRNVASFGDRCEVVQGAVWQEDGEVAYSDEGLEIGHHVSGATGDLRAPAWSIDTLFERWTPDAEVDYVKMDIEGAEPSVLKLNTEWAQRVRAINVEVHEPYSVEECAADLEQLGFTASTRENEGRVTGLR
jgi:FkbM family methyltransferase